MAYGIEVRNNGNRLVIDGNRANYFLVERSERTVTFQEQSGSNTGTVFYKPQSVHFSTTINDSDPPLVFIRHVSGEPVSVVKMNGGPGNWYGFDAMTNCTMGNAGDVSQKTSTLEFEIYVVANDALARAQQAGFFYDSGAGIIINDANGNRVFDSRMVNLAIIDFRTVHTGIPQSQADSAQGSPTYLSSSQAYNAQEPYEGNLLYDIPGDSFVDAFSLMGAFSVLWPMKPFLSSGEVRLRASGRSPAPQGFGPVYVPWTGCHSRASYPMMTARRQTL